MVIPQTPLTNYISELSGESDRLKLAEVTNCFVALAFKKHQYLVKEGAVCAHFCFVESGVLQHAITVDGNEKTTYLALKHSATSSLYSFLNQAPSRKDIKALADSVLWVIDLQTFKNLLAENAVFSRFYYNLLERQICLIDDYRIDLLTMSPEERYRKLLETDPKLLQQVPLRCLASFMGISLRHMSRIRQNAK